MIYKTNNLKSHVNKNLMKALTNNIPCYDERERYIVGYKQYFLTYNGSISVVYMDKNKTSFLQRPTRTNFSFLREKYAEYLKK